MTDKVNKINPSSPSMISPSTSTGNSAQPTTPPLVPSAPKTSKSMSKSMFLGFIILAIALIVVILFVVTHGRKSTKLTTITKPVPITVQITSKGFNPSSLDIKKGTVVEWINSDTSPHRIAANPYPTHSDLPNLDSKSNLGPSSNYSYHFNQSGTFEYHDELNPSINASVKVE